MFTINFINFARYIFKMEHLPKKKNEVNWCIENPKEEKGAYRSSPDTIIFICFIQIR